MLIYYVICIKQFKQALIFLPKEKETTIPDFIKKNKQDYLV